MTAHPGIIGGCEHNTYIPIDPRPLTIAFLLIHHILEAQSILLYQSFSIDRCPPRIDTIRFGASATKKRLQRDRRRAQLSSADPH